MGLAVRAAGLGGIVVVVAGVLWPAAGASGAIEYRLDWSTDNIDIGTDGSWGVVNDLGYEVTITEGELVVHSATLAPCGHTHGFWSDLFDGRLFGLVNEAGAGHGRGGPDPAEVVPSVVESLTEFSATSLGRVEVSEPAYCEGHVALARGTPVEVAEAAGRGNPTATIRIDGTAVAPDGAAYEVVDSELAWGGIGSLSARGEEIDHAEIGSETLEVSIVRDPARFFDGVDFATMDADEQARATAARCGGVDRVRGDRRPRPLVRSPRRPTFRHPATDPVVSCR